MAEQEKVLFQNAKSLYQTMKEAEALSDGGAEKTKEEDVGCVVRRCLEAEKKKQKLGGDGAEVAGAVTQEASASAAFRCLRGAKAAELGDDDVKMPDAVSQEASVARTTRRSWSTCGSTAQ